MENMKLGNLVVTESDREFSKNIKGGNFTVKIPLPSQRVGIISLISRSLSGQDIKAFQPEDYEYVKILITLNNVIESNPNWWEGADKCMDEDLLAELWDFYQESEVKFKKFLKKNNNKGKS